MRILKSNRRDIGAEDIRITTKSLPVDYMNMPHVLTEQK